MSSEDEDEAPFVVGKSCYVLELSVQPGGSRWAELHAYTEVGHLKLLLEHFCKHDDLAAYHSISYGATLAIWVVQRGVVTSVIDLHRHMRAHLPDQTILSLDDRPKLAAYAASFNDDAGFESLSAVKLEAFWDPIEEKLPPLEPPLLGPNEELEVKNRFSLAIPTYLEDSVQQGSYDSEQCERLTPPWEDE